MAFNGIYMLVMLLVEFHYRGTIHIHMIIFKTILPLPLLENQLIHLLVPLIFHGIHFLV
jgi:hypothetical protein